MFSEYMKLGRLHLGKLLGRAHGVWLVPACMLCTGSPVMGLSAADVTRSVRLVFAGVPAAAAGDVNADGVATSADVCATLLGQRNPTQLGPYGVGTRRMTFTKESVTKPGQMRVLDTYFWYPADPVTASLDTHPRGVLNAPLPADTHSLPVIMFSHGSCGIPTQSFFWVTTLASYGFIVAAPPHPGNTTADCVINNTPGAFADSAQNRPADIIFVIDQLLILNDAEDSFFFGAIDPDRIGMSGHSFGGYTTLRVSAEDPRVTAGVALAPAIFGINDEIASIDIPMMLQDGDIDSLTPIEANAAPAFQLLKAPRYLVEILHTGHYAFSDLCVPSQECGQPDTLTQEQAHWAVLRYGVPFLLHYVAGNGQFDAFLAAAATPPGIILTADVHS
jgi:predicted dienelactone hydrolase